MTVLKILIAIAVIILAYIIITEINKFSVRKYGFAPFRISVVLLFALSQILVFIAAVATKKPDLNTYLLLGLAALIVVGLTIYLIIKTNLIIGIFASILQFAIALALLLIIILIFMLSGTGKEAKNES